MKKYLLVGMCVGLHLLAADGFSWGVGSAELAQPGEITLSLEANSILKGHTESMYEGELPAEGRTHFIFSPSVGLLPFWEFSGSVLAGRSVDGTTAYGGFRLSQRFALPEENTTPFRVGVSLDLGQTTLSFSQAMWSAGMGLVTSYQLGFAKVILNPCFTWGLDKGSSPSPSFDPAVRFSAGLTERIEIGVEYLISLGEMGNFTPAGDREEMLFATVDTDWDKATLGVSLGKGLTAPSNPLVAKIVLGTQL